MRDIVQDECPDSDDIFDEHDEDNNNRLEEDELEDEDLDVAAITEPWMILQNNNITAKLASRGYGIYHFN